MPPERHELCSLSHGELGGKRSPRSARGTPCVLGAGHRGHRKRLAVLPGGGSLQGLDWQCQDPALRPGECPFSGQ